MTVAASQLSHVEKLVLRSAKKQLPKIAKESCPYRSGELCRNTGEPCGFSVCPLVNKIAQEHGD